MATLLGQRSSLVAAHVLTSVFLGEFSCRRTHLPYCVALRFPWLWLRRLEESLAGLEAVEVVRTCM